ncbi:MAG: hypothetical protein KatS3mg105_4566 [Gemmatales bacterium]|nr:MAG: hypothetical protein KatS3mg105_4566 [Gemmatales bacterium]
MLTFKRKTKEADLDMTPMIDCVFLLLIFFLLSSSFLSPSTRLSLPRAQADSQKPLPGIIVTLSKKQELFINKSKITRQELAARLRQEIALRDKPEVVLRADRSLEYEKILDVLLAIQRAGCQEVHLAYEPE